MNAVEFHQPVLVGDLVSFYAETVRVGTTSVTVRVFVEAERAGAAGGPSVSIPVTEAEVVLVAVGADGRPVPVHPESGAGGPKAEPL